MYDMRGQISKIEYARTVVDSNVETDDFTYLSSAGGLFGGDPIMGAFVVGATTTAASMGLTSAFGILGIGRKWL